MGYPYNKSFTVDPCEPAWYLKIRINPLPCKLPCYYLSSGPRDISSNATCDICSNNYVLCTSMLLRDNISFVVGIKSSMCFAVNLELEALKSYLYGAPFLKLAIKRDSAIVTIPHFVGEIATYITSEFCSAEIPISALHSDVYHASSKNKITRHLMKDVVWNGVVYHPHFSKFVLGVGR